ncbi:hypothetical protein GCM10009601_59210 [Streptomyces thermospinosisporus]|uniref:Uncharacterized protein n=1 Tax=Streptomyces thermospinosisporus TaxID=161482 RepID=A0ABN1Z6Q4_9ACTN
MPVSEADSSLPITGTATLMIVTSRITMKYPAHTASSGAKDRRSAATTAPVIFGEEYAGMHDK